MASIHDFIHDRRILVLVVLVMLSLLLVAWRGVHLGIEFEGGTRLPLTLDHPVSQAEMEEITNIIKSRTTKFGLSQVRVKGVGDSQIYVEMPKSDVGLVAEIERLVEEEGRFEGIVDGVVAVRGKDLITSSIQDRGASVRGNQVQWEVSFAITTEGAHIFADAAKGKANMPLLLFLDRPEKAFILSPRSLILNQTLQEQESLDVLRNALRKENTSIPLFFTEDWSEVKTQLAYFEKRNETTAIVPEGLDPIIYAELAQMGFIIENKSASDMAPALITGREGLAVETWGAIGLISAPYLSPDVTQGQLNQLFSISGSAPGATFQEREQNSFLEAKRLRSVLSGGAIPVRLYVGSATNIPAPLGAEFLKYSVLGAVMALAAIGILVSVRYRTLKIIVPIIIVSITELIILVSILGAVGTIDLATMAGIIAALGVSVDAQIIITDEVLRKEDELSEQMAQRKLERAFHIITSNVAIAVLAMLPLMFSGLVEIIGFATSHILGSILGLTISRPAYGAIVEKLFLEPQNKQGKN